MCFLKISIRGRSNFFGIEGMQVKFFGDGDTDRFRVRLFFHGDRPI